MRSSVALRIRGITCRASHSFFIRRPTGARRTLERPRVRLGIRKWSRPIRTAFGDLTVATKWNALLPTVLTSNTYHDVRPPAHAGLPYLEPFGLAVDVPVRTRSLLVRLVVATDDLRLPSRRGISFRPCLPFGGAHAVRVCANANIADAGQSRITRGTVMAAAVQGTEFAGLRIPLALPGVHLRPATESHTYDDQERVR